MIMISKGLAVLVVAVLNWLRQTNYDRRLMDGGPDRSIQGVYFLSLSEIVGVLVFYDNLFTLVQGGKLQRILHLIKDNPIHVLKPPLFGLLFTG